MVRKLTLIFLLLCGSAGATVDSTIGNTNWSTWSPGANDTLIVRSGDTLFRDVSGGTAGIVFVRSGGIYYENIGSSATIKHLYLGGISGTPFSSTNGGKWFYNRSSSTTFAVGGPLTYQVYFGPNSTTGNNTRGGVENTLQCTGGFGQMYCDNTTADILLQYCIIRRFMKTGFNGGIKINSVGRTGKTRITHCTTDSTNIAIQNAIGQKIDSCTFTVYQGQSQCIWLQYSNKDSIIGNTINSYSLGGGTAYGIYVNTCDSPYIYGNRVTAYSEPAGMNSWGILLTQYLSGESGTRWAKLISDTVIGFGFTVQLSKGREALISNSYINAYGTAHEALFITQHPKWQLWGSTLIKGSGGGRSAILMYPAIQTDVPDSCRLYYNTVVAIDVGGQASSPLAFENQGTVGNLVYRDVKMVGNLLVGDNAGYHRAEMIFGTTPSQTVTVNFTEFKKNAFDSIYYFGSSSGTYPYSRLDSNKHDQTAFAFVDSLNGDFRLSSGSPVINCGDSTYAIGVYGSAQASKAPFDIGYYQSYTTGTCGGAPSTPTGACCYNYVCAVTTQVNCTTAAGSGGLGGVYQGDGTTTCASCTAPAGANPAPRSKQLNIACLAYYAPFLQSNFGGYVPIMRDWAANRFSIIYTSGGASDAANIAYMKTINPNLKVTGYNVYSRLGGIYNDSANIVAYSALSGIPIDSMFLRTGPQSGDSVRLLGNTGGANGVSYATPGGNNFIKFYQGATDATHLRYAFDPRKWQFGAYLYYMLKQQMAAANLDGIILDEETRLTGSFPRNAGFQPYSLTDWPVGMDSIVRPFTGINIANMPDSQKRWRHIWAKTLGDSMAANGKIIVPNGASWWGIQVSLGMQGYLDEGKDAIMAYGGGFINETMSQYYSYNANSLKFFPLIAYDLKDSAVNLGLGYWPVGPVDMYCTALRSISWQRQSFLGNYLMCEFPRTNGSKLYIHPKWQSGQYGPAPYASPNDFLHNYSGVRSWVCSQNNTSYPSDSGFIWSDCWGKYFGVPSNVRDTSQTGTDGAGQSYKVWKVGLSRPDNGTPLTFAAMRYPATTGSGGTYGATSNVDVALPTGTWYELIDNYNDSANIGSSKMAFWRPTALTGGSTFTLGNGQARIFSTDTVLSNAGPNQSYSATISISDATVTEGGSMSFTVTLSAAQVGITSFNYSTANGTALSGTDYTSQSGSKNIAAGVLTTTIEVPTTNRASCQQSRAFTVTISSVIPSTITITDPTGTGTITDDDCGTTYGKTYKGKIVIKGKVKP